MNEIKSLHIFDNDNIIAIEDDKLYQFIPGNDSILKVKKIKILLDGKEIALPERTTFLKTDDELLLWSPSGILKTKIQAKEPFTDSVIRVEPIKLNFPELNLHTNDYLYAVVPGEKDELFFRSSRGIYKYNKRLRSVERIRVEFFKYPAYPGHRDNALHYGGNGVLWAGVYEGLVKIVIKNKPFQWIKNIHPDNGRLRPLNGFIDSNNHLWSVHNKDSLGKTLPDHHGNYKKKKLYKLHSNDTATQFSVGMGVALEDSQDRLWANSAFMVQWMNVDKPGIFHRLSFLDYIDKYNIFVNYTATEFMEDPEGNILISTYDPSYSWLITSNMNKAYVITLDSAGTVAYWPTFVKTEDGELYMHNDSKFYRIDSNWVMHDDSLLNTKQKDELPLPWAHPKKTELLFDLDSLDSYFSRILLTEYAGEKDIWIDVKQIGKFVRCNLNALKINPETPSIALSFFPQEKDKYIAPPVSWVADKNGKLWYSTSNGLFCIDPATCKTLRFFMEDGLPSNHFLTGAHVSLDGMLNFSTSVGLIYFYPDTIRPDPPPKVYFTELELFNKPVAVGPESILKTSIACADKTRLTHKQNFIGISFAALDYRNSKHIQYKYKLEGLDAEWILADDGKKAVYPNLQPGKYVFHVIAANGNGVWNTESASLEIRILAPMWLRWWAICLEGLFLIFLLIIYIRYREQKLKQTAVELEEKVDSKTKEILEQRKEVDDMKSRFYTNISHEFRTPLSLLLGPLENSLKIRPFKADLSEKVVEMMHRNAKRLQRLINQLLDVSKLESGKMFLNFKPGKISNFVNAIAGSFLSLAESKNIIYSIDIQHAGKTTLFDADKLEKIITNLLSNAFKFTQDGDTVKLSFSLSEISTKGDACLAQLIVSDTGRGISKEQQLHIFERFYQASDSDTRIAEGSGIGLSLTKELVELMEGTIRIESQVGKGTTFQVQFPLSYTSAPAIKLQAIAPEVFSTVSEATIPTYSADESNKEEKHEKGKTIILIVEDNEDLRDYIALQFSESYRLIKSINGKDGFEKALKHLPDLIVTDLMMPEMDGIELCNKLKSHPDTSLIPVIMLTAKADKKSRLDGLKVAVDDYITKPFDSEELIVRSENLIRQRLSLRQKLTQQILVQKTESQDPSSEEKILNNYMAVIDRFISDPKLSVQLLADQLNVSRTQLFRKIHMLLGTTPKEFIRLARMKKAAAHLEEGKLSVTQVMYQVGMQNTSHFSMSFKKYYGVNPGEYQAKKG